MALTDWTFYVTGGGVPAVVNSPVAPVGLRWLDLPMVSNGFVQYVGIPKQPPYRSTGMYTAVFRTLIRLTDTGQRSQGGLLFACSQEDMRQLNGSRCYAVILDYRASIPPPHVQAIRLVRFNNGVTDVTVAGDIIASSPDSSFTIGVTFALEVSWKLARHGEQICCHVRTGNAVNFADLVPVPSLEQVLISPAGVASAATLGFTCANWQSTNAHMYLDQTSLEYLG